MNKQSQMKSQEKGEIGQGGKSDNTKKNQTRSGKDQPINQQSSIDQTTKITKQGGTTGQGTEQRKGNKTEMDQLKGQSVNIKNAAIGTGSKSTKIKKGHKPGEEIDQITQNDKKQGGSGNGGKDQSLTIQQKGSKSKKVNQKNQKSQGYQQNEQNDIQQEEGDHQKLVGTKRIKKSQDIQQVQKNTPIQQIKNQDKKIGGKYQSSQTAKDDQQTSINEAKHKNKSKIKQEKTEERSSQQINIGHISKSKHDKKDAIDFKKDKTRKHKKDKNEPISTSIDFKKQISKTAENSQSTKQKQNVVKVEPLNLQKRLQNSDKLKIWTQSSKFKGVTQNSSSTEVCHFSFRIMKYPDEKRFITKNKEFLSESEREMMLLYKLVYCTDCCIPVYWMCLSENTHIQEVKIKNRKYLVFQCEPCLARKQGSKQEIKCLECSNYGGFMKKISLSTQKAQNNNEFGFIHPVCAMSFPNIYQLGGPANMNFKLISNLDSKEVYKVPQIKDNPTLACSFCNKQTPRILKCQEFAKHKMAAHAFCILDKNKELVYQVDALQRYQFEDQMPIKWSFQMFFKDTYDNQRNCFEKKGTSSHDSQSDEEFVLDKTIDPKIRKIETQNSQSPFIRVQCNEQRNHTILCHCENRAIEKDNVTQCQACFSWFHQECWGDHVDLSEGGPSKQYLKEENQNKDAQSDTITEEYSDKDETENEDEKKEDNEEQNESIHDEEHGEDEIEGSIQTQSMAQSEENKTSDIIKFDNSSEQITEKYKGSSEKQEDFLLCGKCLRVSKLSKSGLGGLADIILNTKTVENLMPPGTYNKNMSVSTAHKLHGLPPHDFRIMASWEFSIFEHVLLYRFWYKLLEQCYRRKFHEELYKDLLNKSQVHIFNNMTLDNLVNKKLKESQKITKDLQNMKHEVFFFKDIFKSGQLDKLSEENLNQNEKEKLRLKQFVDEKMGSHYIINETTATYYNQLQQAINYENIAKVYKGQYADSNDIKDLIQYLRSSPNFEHTQSISYRKLYQDFYQYQNWENKIIDLFRESKCDKDEKTIITELEELQNAERSAEGLSKLQYDYLKKLFIHKISIEQAEQMIEEGKALFIQSLENIERIREKIQKSIQCQEIEHAATYPKPIKKLYEHISQIAQLNIKPDQINDILLRFRHSQELKITAESFICDKIEDNDIWLFETFKKGLDSKDIIQQYKGSQKQQILRKKTFRDKYRSYVFIKTQINDLKGKINKSEYFIDKQIKEKVIEKISKIEQIQGQHYQYIKSESATQEEIQQFIKMIDEIENVDLDQERDIAKQKLSLIRLGKRYLDGTLMSSIKQNEVNIRNLLTQSGHSGGGGMFHSSNKSSGRKFQNAQIMNMSSALQDQSFMSQQSLNLIQDIENLKYIIDSECGEKLSDEMQNISQIPPQSQKRSEFDDYDENLYRIVDAENAIKGLDDQNLSLDSYCKSAAGSNKFNKLSQDKRGLNQAFLATKDGTREGGLDSNLSSTGMSYFEIDQDDLMKAMKLLESQTRQQGVYTKQQ